MCKWCDLVPGQWDIDSYLEVCRFLLKTHFSVPSNAFELFIESNFPQESVTSAIEREIDPYRLVSRIAKDHQMFRIDHKHPAVLREAGLATAARCPLTIQEQIEAVRLLGVQQESREAFENQVYQQYALKAFVQTYQRKAQESVNRDDLLKRDGEEYLDEGVAAMWHGWRMAQRHFS